MFINKFVQKCQYCYTLLDQSVPLVTVTSVVSLLTKQLWLKFKLEPADQIPYCVPGNFRMEIVLLGHDELRNQECLYLYPRFTRCGSVCFDISQDTNLDQVSFIFLWRRLYKQTNKQTNKQTYKQTYIKIKKQANHPLTLFQSKFWNPIDFIHLALWQ